MLRLQRDICLYRPNTGERSDIFSGELENGRDGSAPVFFHFERALPFISDLFIKIFLPQVQA